MGLNETAPAGTPPPWTAYSDGSALPNPGRMGLGAVITAPDGTRHTLSQLAREIGCNNEAELLRADGRAAGAEVSSGADMFVVHCDNSIVVEQLTNGRGPAKPIARLAPLFEEVRAARSLRSARPGWCGSRGHRNGEADGLARAALGFAPRPPARHAKRHAKKKRR
jgi:ribonuclease HI